MSTESNIDIAESLIAQKRIGITGATGFVGSHLTRRLLALGTQTRVLVRKSSDKNLRKELADAGAEIVLGDVTDRGATDALSENCDILIHIAALFRQAKHEDSMYYAVNVEGTRNMLDSAEKSGIKRFVHCSTVGVHSHIQNPPADESEDFRPADVYQVSKCEGEKLARERFKSASYEGVVVRPAMIWGEGDKRILKLFRGVAKRTMPIIGDGKTLTHWVHVSDLVNGFILAATHEAAAGQTYIFAGATPVTIKELMCCIADIAGVKLLPLQVPAMPVQVLGSLVEKCCVPFGVEPPIYRRRVDFFTKNRCFNIDKARSELGYQPQMNFEEEVKRIYRWCEQQGWLG